MLIYIGEIIYQYFQGYGYHLVFNGMLPNWGCRYPTQHPDPFSEALGYPCHNGGSVGVTALDRGDTPRCSLLFYMSANRPRDLEWIRLDGTRLYDARDRYVAVREHCKVHMSRPVDLTAMAQCIYLNFPRIFDSYPPPRRTRGRRMRGVAIIPGGENERLSREAAFESVGGGLILDFFDMPHSDLNTLPITLTCICALPPNE